MPYKAKRHKWSDLIIMVFRVEPMTSFLILKLNIGQGFYYYLDQVALL